MRRWKSSARWVNREDGGEDCELRLSLVVCFACCVFCFGGLIEKVSYHRIRIVLYGCLSRLACFALSRMRGVYDMFCVVFFVCVLCFCGTVAGNQNSVVLFLCCHKPLYVSFFFYMSVFHVASSVCISSPLSLAGVCVCGMNWGVKHRSRFTFSTPRARPVPHADLPRILGFFRDVFRIFTC